MRRYFILEFYMHCAHRKNVNALQSLLTVNLKLYRINNKKKRPSILLIKIVEVCTCGAGAQLRTLARHCNACEMFLEQGRKKSGC